MDRKSLLVERLSAYGGSDVYPFHMPGHKRQKSFPNPFAIDITEIAGFDNLHHPEGILKESMEWAASVYGADRTYYLINGSSSGILSAVCAATSRGGAILMSRNCHKSAYHGAILQELRAAYVYPQIVEPLGIQGGILAEDVDNLLARRPDIQAVLVVSPTYDGVVSDIRAIAETVHGYGLPLIVDEAHGAHFPFGGADGAGGRSFPASALECGADVVVQSLHKTLGSFTQTAVLHVRGGRVDTERIERYLQIFQSSSPSYVLMAGLEESIFEMAEHGRQSMAEFSGRIRALRGRLTGGQGLARLRLAGRELCGSYGIYDLDESKLVVSARGCGLRGAGRDAGDSAAAVSGVMLGRRLREEYLLEMELCGADYVTAITSYLDTEEGLSRLSRALLEIDGQMTRLDAGGGAGAESGAQVESGALGSSDAAMTMAEALGAPYEEVLLEESAGRICAEFIYLYPPGIPIVAPGEMVAEETAAAVIRYRKLGLPVQGPADQSASRLRVIK